MKYLLLSFFCIALVSSLGAQHCIDLPDGTYSVKLKSETLFELTVDHKKYIRRLKDGTLVNGNIETMDCLIYFKDSLLNETAFESKLKEGLGSPVMQITKIERGTIYFKTIRSGNINIVLDEGVMQLVRTITGRIIDSFDFQPMPEANLRLGSSVLATSDREGNFTAQLPQNADTLLVTFIGMEPMSIKLSDTCTRVEVIMIPDGTYDYMSIGKINRRRKKYFDELPEKHKLAFDKGVFERSAFCFEYLFKPQR